MTSPKIKEGRLEKAARKQAFDLRYLWGESSDRLERELFTPLLRFALRERKRALKEADAELDRYGAGSVMPQDWHDGLNAARARLRALGSQKPR